LPWYLNIDGEVVHRRVRACIDLAIERMLDSPTYVLSAKGLAQAKAAFVRMGVYAAR
jgi:hypothetical protein